MTKEDKPDFLSLLPLELGIEFTIREFDGVLFLDDELHGQAILSSAKEIVDRLNLLYNGLDGATILYQDAEGWSGLEISPEGRYAGIYYLRSATMAGALAEATGRLALNCVSHYAH